MTHITQNTLNLDDLVSYYRDTKKLHPSLKKIIKEQVKKEALIFCKNIFNFITKNSETKDNIVFILNKTKPNISYKDFHSFFDINKLEGHKDFIDLIRQFINHTWKHTVIEELYKLGIIVFDKKSSILNLMIFDENRNIKVSKNYNLNIFLYEKKNEKLIDYTKHYIFTYFEKTKRIHSDLKNVLIKEAKKEVGNIVSIIKSKIIEIKRNYKNISPDKMLFIFYKGGYIEIKSSVKYEDIIDIINKSFGLGIPIKTDLDLVWEAYYFYKKKWGDILSNEIKRAGLKLPKHDFVVSCSVFHNRVIDIFITKTSFV